MVSVVIFSVAKTEIFSDQLLDCQRRYTQKYNWVKKVFEHVVCMVIVNSISLKRTITKKHYRTLDFKKELMEQLRKVGKVTQVLLH